MCLNLIWCTQSVLTFCVNASSKSKWLLQKRTGSFSCGLEKHSWQKLLTIKVEFLFFYFHSKMGGWGCHISAQTFWSDRTESRLSFLTSALNIILSIICNSALYEEAFKFYAEFSKIYHFSIGQNHKFHPPLKKNVFLELFSWNLI